MENKVIAIKSNYTEVIQLFILPYSEILEELEKRAKDIDHPFYLTLTTNVHYVIDIESDRIADVIEYLEDSIDECLIEDISLLDEKGVLSDLCHITATKYGDDIFIYITFYNDHFFDESAEVNLTEIIKKVKQNG